MAASLPPLSWNAADAEIDYPTSDGRPFDSDLHRRVMMDTIERLSHHFAGQDVYVSGNILLFYEQGSPRRFVSPDVLVTKHLAPGLRDHYLVWREGRAPDVVIEVTGKSTRSEDFTKKFNLYRDVLRIREYFLFDPRGDYLSPPLHGYRLSGARYAPITERANRLTSVELGLTLAAGEGDLILFDPRRRRRRRRLLTARESLARMLAKPSRAARVSRQELARMAAENRRLSAEFKRVSRENAKLRRRLSERDG